MVADIGVFECCGDCWPPHVVRYVEALEGQDEFGCLVRDLQHRHGEPEYRVGLFGESHHLGYGTHAPFVEGERVRLGG